MAMGKPVAFEASADELLLFEREAQRFQASADDLHASAIFGRDGVTGDDLFRQFERVVSHYEFSSS